MSLQQKLILHYCLGGRYYLHSVLGKGGMATVYLAQDTHLHRPVAVKVLHTHLSAESEYVERFYREAHLAAKIYDPHIVSILDFSYDDEYAYIVMELVVGGTIKELLGENGPMPPYAVASITQPILQALHAAHAQGVIHRDVKPENILISKNGWVKITDFGVVKALHMDNPALTSTGTVLGTPAYLSPEQILDEPLTPQTDIYSLGITIFEMLTGKLPFKGSNSVQLALARLSQAVPPPSSYIAGIDPAMDDFVLQATAHNPSHRFQDCQHMLHELEDIIAYNQYEDWEITPPRHRTSLLRTQLNECETHMSSGFPTDTDEDNYVNDDASYDVAESTATLTPTTCIEALEPTHTPTPEAEAYFSTEHPRTSEPQLGEHTHKSWSVGLFILLAIIALSLLVGFFLGVYLAVEFPDPFSLSTINY